MRRDEMSSFSELRIHFYRYCELPTEATYQALEEVKKRYIREYGDEAVKVILQEAQLTVDREQLKISPHLPYSH